MKKSLISSLIASTLLLVGAAFPTITKANTTTIGDIDYGTQGTVTTNQMAFLHGLSENVLYQITNRGLAANSPWYYDQTITGADGIKYYRIATNEWVGSNYLGQINDNSITTNNNQPSDLVNTDGKIVGNSESKIYHLPWQHNYKIKSTNIVYFNSEQDAINAGYQKSKR